MSKWLWALAVAVQSHCGASYVAGLPADLSGTAIVSVLAALAVLDIWLSPTSWRGLAAAGAVMSPVLMIGFFGPTKLLPMALNLAVLVAIWTGWAPVRPRIAAVAATACLPVMPSDTAGALGRERANAGRA